MMSRTDILGEINVGDEKRRNLARLPACWLEWPSAYKCYSLVYEGGTEQPRKVVDHLFSSRRTEFNDLSDILVELSSWICGWEAQE